MHPFDICAIIIAAIGCGLGLKRGLIIEVFRFLAVFGGFIGAFLTYPTIFTYLSFISFSHTARTVIAFFTAYIAIAASLLLIGWIIKKLIHFSMLGWVDRLCGAALGAAKSALIIWIIVVALKFALSPESRIKLEPAWTYQTLMRIPLNLTIPRIDMIHPPGRPGIDTFKDSLENLKTRMQTLKELPVVRSIAGTMGVDSTGHETLH